MVDSVSSVSPSNSSADEQNRKVVKFQTLYLNKFNAEKVIFTEGKEVPLGDLWVSNCSLRDVALGILAKIDWLRNSSNIRDKVLYNGYLSVTVKYPNDDDSFSERIVSIYHMAKQVMRLESDQDFVYATMKMNWRWTIDKNVKEVRGFDPFGLAKTELDIKLKDAKMTLLVKIFRMYLMETVRRVFPRNRNQQKWQSSDAVYKVGGTERSSGDFVKYVDELLKLYDQIVLLTPDLTEVKAVVNSAIALGKEESSQKREQYQKLNNMEANYKQSIGIDISSGVGTRKDQPKDRQQFSKTVVTQQSKPSVWNNQKTFVDKLVENGDYVKPVNNDENTQKDENVEEKQQKRTVKSGGPKSKEQNKSQPKSTEQKKPKKEKVQKEKTYVDPTPQQLASEGYTTVIKHKKDKPDTDKAVKTAKSVPKGK